MQEVFLGGWALVNSGTGGLTCIQVHAAFILFISPIFQRDIYLYTQIHTSPPNNSDYTDNPSNVVDELKSYQECNSLDSEYIKLSF